MAFASLQSSERKTNVQEDTGGSTAIATAEQCFKSPSDL